MLQDAARCCKTLHESKDSKKATFSDDNSTLRLQGPQAKAVTRAAAVFDRQLKMSNFTYCYQMAGICLIQEDFLPDNELGTDEGSIEPS